MKGVNTKTEPTTAGGPLYVVPCSQTKHSHLKTETMAARDAYVGQAFRMLRAKMERAGAKWCILSGGYGFLWPDTRIEDYDCKMLPVTKYTYWDTAFDEIKQKQYGRLIAAQRVVVLGSRLYAENAANILDREVEAPFAGLPIGKMLRAISFWDPETTLPETLERRAA
jgi:hypothetical protein